MASFALGVLGLLQRCTKSSARRVTPPAWQPVCGWVGGGQSGGAGNGRAAGCNKRWKRELLLNQLWINADACQRSKSPNVRRSEKEQLTLPRSLPASNTTAAHDRSKPRPEPFWGPELTPALAPRTNIHDRVAARGTHPHNKLRELVTLTLVGP